MSVVCASFTAHGRHVNMKTHRGHTGVTTRAKTHTKNAFLRNVSHHVSRAGIELTFGSGNQGGGGRLGLTVHSSPLNFMNYRFLSFQVSFNSAQTNLLSSRMCKCLFR